MINVVGTGSNLSEAEGEIALPNGAKVARCVAKTPFSMCAELLGT